MFLFRTPPPDFFPGVETAGCYCEYQDKILLLQRSTDKSQPHTWGIPGGKMEEGESPLECVVRELYEETKLLLSKDQLSSLGPVFMRLPTHQFVFHLFRFQFKNLPPLVILNQENEAFKWITLKDAYLLPLMMGADECLNVVYKECLT
jgi:8-oxo-dGTP pyrophosphatase MutT (NUDIX family)